MLEALTALLADGAIPAQVKANLLGAAGRLCSAALDVPTAYLEGRANEIRATSSSRVMLTEEATNQMAEKMEVSPDYSAAAAQKFASKVLREQINVDKVFSLAAGDLRDSGSHYSKGEWEDAKDPVDEDWLNTFENEARQKSTEEFQFLFGKVLAGEIRQPGTFSIKTLKILSSIDKRTAETFRTLCSLSVQCSLGKQLLDGRVPSLGGNPASNSLKDYGLDFRSLNLLNEHGLVISDYNSWFDYRTATGVPLSSANQYLFVPFMHQSKYWILFPRNGITPDNPFKLSGIEMTASGRELLSIVESEPAESYTLALKEFFGKSNLNMTEVGDNSPRVLSL